MIVHSLARQRITLGEPIARGGEATVHEVVGARETLAKIYSTPREGYDRKLIWMVANPPDLHHGHPSIAWPQELLYNAQGHFAGYLMPRISGGAVKLLEVFNPRVRAKVMPKFNWRYLHRAARNLSAALAALHACDYVVGDLNESNILVMPTALVTLIDTDSFQVRAVTQNHVELYPCPVARLEYTPPELQGHAPSERRPEHDNFGLAVLIFQLLMDGSHPFRGRWLASGEPPSIEERIRSGWFPYANASGGRIAELPSMLPFSALDPQVATLFTRCFVAGHRDPSVRPAAGEWRDTLDAAEKNLQECAQHHMYAKHLSACPWCGLRRETVRVAPAPGRTKTPREERRARRARPRMYPVPTFQSPPPFAAPFPAAQPFSVPTVPRNFTLPRVPRATINNALAVGSGSLRYGFTVVATLGNVLSAIARGMAAPNWRAWWRASVLVLSGATAGTLLWAALGAGSGALVGALAAVWDHVLVLNVLLAHAREGAVYGASVAVILGLVYGALVEAIARFRATGGALTGLLVGGALGVLAPVNMSGTWQNFMALSMLLGGLFALASLPVASVPRGRRLGAAAAATLAAMQRLEQRSTWLVLGGSVMSAALLSVLLWFLAWTSAPITIVLAAFAGFVGGVFVAVSARRP